MAETSQPGPQSPPAGVPDDVPEFVVFEGHVGPSDREGHVRLYTGLDLTAFYEFPIHGVERTESADRDNSPTRVFVKTVAVVSYHEGPGRGEASFLEGDIAAGNLADVAAVEAVVYERPTVLIAGSNPPRKCFRQAVPGSDGLC